MRKTLIALMAALLGAAAAAPVSAAPAPGAGYGIALWASGSMTDCSNGQASPTCYYNPDSITHLGGEVFVGYQNNGAADGTTGSSEVVQYTGAATGTPVAYFHLPGKNDGLRVDPATGYVWALSNEDANPILTILHPGTPAGTPSTYHLDTETKFAGGYDDIAFTPSGTFISASNPGGNQQGSNNYRAIVAIHFNGSGEPALTPILEGSPTGTDRATGAQVKVNLTDPDSLSVDTAGDLVLNDQGDSTLVFVTNPGTANQSVSFSFLQPGSPIVDESTWAASANGHFLVANHNQPGQVYSLTRAGGFVASQAYTTVSNDKPTAPAARSISTLDSHTGAVTPVVTGFSSPKGLEFIP